MGKFCTKCGLEKDESEFNKHKVTKDGLNSWCKMCAKENHKKWYTENFKQIREQKIKNKFGITIDQYNEMLLKQNNKCAICGKHQNENKKSLAVDHNHKTGHVRGLLCYNCNISIGKLGDDLFGLIKAVDYIIEAEKEWL